jgi:hypothetical protein
MKGKSNVKAWYAKQRILEPLSSVITLGQRIAVSIIDLDTKDNFLFGSVKDAAKSLHISTDTIYSNADRKSTLIVFEKNKETGILIEKKFLITVFRKNQNPKI